MSFYKTTRGEKKKGLKMEIENTEQKERIIIKRQKRKEEKRREIEEEKQTERGQGGGKRSPSEASKHTYRH